MMIDYTPLMFLTREERAQKQRELCNCMTQDFMKGQPLNALFYHSGECLAAAYGAQDYLEWGPHA